MMPNGLAIVAVRGLAALQYG